jgi:hypothetical protein
MQSTVKVPNNILETFLAFFSEEFKRNSKLDQLLHIIWIIIAEVRVDAT